MVTPLKSQTRRAKLIEIILLTLFGVLMYISQVIMAPLPNIEIVSLLIIIITRKFGVKALCSVYVFVICELFTYGMGVWSVNYLYVWTILWLLVFIIRWIDSTAVYTFVSGIYGIAFGTMCAIPYFFVGGISMFVATVVSGVWFDILHCAGNLILTFLLYRPLMKAMNYLVKSDK